MVAGKVAFTNAETEAASVCGEPASVTPKA